MAGRVVRSMKITVELPDRLLFEAKRKALETGTTLREIMERALRRELRQTGNRPARRPRRIRWVTSAGGLPSGLDVSDRTKMYGWMQKEHGSIAVGIKRRAHGFNRSIQESARGLYRLG
jgi:hypothetical protein